MKKKYKKIMPTLALCFLVVIFTLSFSSTVSAEQTGCCELSNSQDICSQTTASECSTSSFAQGVSCEQTSFCQRGCCFDEGAGIFEKGVLEKDCTKQWDADATCNIQGSQKGCCILGSTTAYETKGQCQSDTTQRGISQLDWKDSITEQECSLIPSNQERGACVFNNQACTLTTQKECASKAGDFAQGFLCTAQELNTTCKKTTQTTCEVNRDEVYFIDSCGNSANIYDATKINNQSYWEKIIPKSESCNADSPTANADSYLCGNCNKYEGSICKSAAGTAIKPKSGENYCADIGCEVNGTRYKSGESWCGYQSAVGKNSVVGSRDRVYQCNQGKVSTSLCNDFRENVCLQSNTKENDVVVWKNAACVRNTGNVCLALNEKYADDKETLEEECKKELSCRVQSVEIDRGFNFSTCLPQYPLGFDTSTQEGIQTAENSCALATKTCKVKRKRKLSGGCRIVKNKNCLQPEFTEAMNNLCTGIGDCGGKANIAGDYVQNYRLKKATPISNETVALLKSYAIPTLGAYALLGESYLEFMQRMGFEDSSPRFNASLAERIGMVERTIQMGLLIAAVASSFTNPYIGVAIGIIGVASFTEGIANTIWGKCKTKEVKYTCEAWEPPRGGERCEECNSLEGGCTQYACESLGGGCNLINADDSDPSNDLCVNQCRGESTAPTITPNKDLLSENVTYENIKEKSVTLQSKNAPCIDPNTPIRFGITTDKPSICRWDYETKSYDDMGNTFKNAFGFNHSLILSLPDVTHGISQGINWTGKETLFIRCQDNCGFNSPDIYSVNVCVNAGKDVTGPVIRKTTPSNNALIGFETESQEVTIFTNELATCKADTEDKEYENMRISFYCNDTFAAQSSPFGYVCKGNLPTLNKENAYKIACKDQPWFTGTENASQQNIREMIYSIKKPEEKISIDWILPDSDIITPTNLATFNLQIQTANGGLQHQCSWRPSKSSAFIPLFPPIDNLHEQKGIELSPGTYTFLIQCSDETKDTVEKEVLVTIIKDTSAPLISRITNTAGEIEFITTEEAECAYTTSSCLFNWENATMLRTGQIHTVSTKKGTTYFIQCKDNLGNLPTGCSARIVAV